MRCCIGCIWVVIVSPFQNKPNNTEFIYIADYVKWRRIKYIGVNSMRNAIKVLIRRSLWQPCETRRAEDFIHLFLEKMARILVILVKFGFIKKIDRNRTKCVHSSIALWGCHGITIQPVNLICFSSSIFISIWIKYSRDTIYIFGLYVFNEHSQCSLAFFLLDYVIIYSFMKATKIKIKANEFLVQN